MLQKTPKVETLHPRVGVMVSVVVGSTRTVVARIVVVPRAVGAAGGDLIRRTAAEGVESELELEESLEGILD